MDQRVVAIDTGLIEGEIGPGYQRFLGIPFAAPPVGQWRWRAPQPMTPWAGVRRADRFGCAPVQPLLPGDALMRQFSFAVPPECGISEDCLYLNVWAPAEGGNHPVLVWLYGGGHRVGAGSHPVSDGAALARKGLVVVTLNYRVGALGYLAHPALSAESGGSGNYATQDILAALQWVQRNIAAFGGDEARVTLAGQSAGAAHVHVLMSMKAAQGLFHRAIAHSGGRARGGLLGARLLPLAEAEQQGARLMGELGARSLDELRNMPADAMAGPPRFWNIIEDGQWVCEQPDDVFARGAPMDVPLITGFNAQDGVPYPVHEIETAAKFAAFARDKFGTDAAAFTSIYGGGSDEAARAASYVYRRDAGFAYQAWRIASQHRQARMFVFDHAPPGGDGAHHGAELWYAFDNLAQQQRDWRQADHAVANLFADYYAAFAASGDPNGEGRPHWPVFDSDAQALHFGKETAAAALPNLAALQLIAAHQ